MSDSMLRPYYLSKWNCDRHGRYEARTIKPVDAAHPIPCPECKPALISQLAGRTSQVIPYISKPRIPKQTKSNPNASPNAPLRKRGVSW